MPPSAKWSDAALLGIVRKEYLAAFHAHDAAFGADPKLLETYPLRYNAICCAALAARGEGADPGVLTNDEHAALRAMALAWMRAEVATWRAGTLGSKPERSAAVDNLKSSETDADLTGVRDEQALQLLPAEEGESWRALWREIADLITQAESKK